MASKRPAGDPRPTRGPAEVNPPIEPVVPWRVVRVGALPGMRLDITFADGTHGEVELGTLLRGEKVLGTVFEPLWEPTFFARARIAYGAVEWPNGADLAPDAMYETIRRTGRWVLSSAVPILPSWRSR
jgi:Protein of unknown function (DUF2442)